MSVAPTIPELQTEESKDLFNHYKTGVIGPTEEVELFELIANLKERYQKTFKLRDILTKSFDYTAFEVKRLDSEYNKWLKRQIKDDIVPAEAQAPGTPVLNAKAKEVTTGATKALLDQVQELGKILVLEYGQKAALRGLGVKDYTLKCVEFYEQYGDQTEAILQENEELKALTSILVQAVKPQFKQMAATRIYVDFILQTIQLSALGYELDESFVSTVMGNIEVAMGTKISQ
jgi:hypothetical protein